MATTGQNFLLLSGTPASMLAASPATAGTIVSAGAGVVVDKSSVDLSKTVNGFAKNGAFTLNLLTSTPQTVDFTALSGLTLYAGDTAFALWNLIAFRNSGAHDITVTPGASNPLRVPFAGTTPTYTVPANGTLYQPVWYSAAGLVVDSTHKNLTFDPGANTGTISVSVGGA